MISPRATGRRGRWAFPRWQIGSLRWWSKDTWSRRWSLYSTRTAMGTGPEIGVRSGRRAAAAMLALRLGGGLDIKAFFDSIDPELMMRAVQKHTDCPWALLYIDSWLKAPAEMADGRLVGRQEARRRAGSSAPSWRISFFTMRSTCGCVGTSRTSVRTLCRRCDLSLPHGRPSHGASDSA